MDMDNYNPEHRKGQHLTEEERHLIEVRYNKDKKSIYQIAKELNRPFNTIKNELKRGCVTLYHGSVTRYKADKGKEQYLKNREESRRKYKVLQAAKFIKYVMEYFFKYHWSLDECYGRVILENKFTKEERVCTRTLYRYIDLNLIAIKNTDLPEKLLRNTKRQKVRMNRKKLGRSIEERPREIYLRGIFGHWEIDSILGKKNENEPVVIAITERKLRMTFWIKAKNHSAEAMDEALAEFFEQFGDRLTRVFKSITADNGSEFANLSGLEEKGINIYFTHPYTSYEKGTVERHNRMFRRFIPKGKSIDDYTADEIMGFADIINGMPRKILKYHTPEELFEAEMDKIYTA